MNQKNKNDQIRSRMEKSLKKSWERRSWAFPYMLSLGPIPLGLCVLEGELIIRIVLFSLIVGVLTTSLTPRS